MQLVLTTELLLDAYRQGLFPMAYSAGSPYIHWVCPERRGQLSITDLHISRKLRKTIRRGLREKSYEIRTDTAFDQVIEYCAEAAADRPETWINAPIIEAYGGLHRDGHAHSIEYWQDGKLAGGLYGLSIGGAFFGESMFSRARDASKIALVHLCARLWKGGYTILDTQFVNDHLEQFGVYEIPHEDYLKALKPALDIKSDFQLGDLNEENILQDYFEMRGF